MIKIASPMATGNGAFVVHQQIAASLAGYELVPYNPYWTLAPFLLPMLRQKQADLIHTTPDYAPFFKSSGQPLVITFHGYVLDAAMRKYSSVAQRIHYATDLKWFTRRALREATCVTSVSQFMADLVRQETQYAGPIRVIYNGIDTDAFVPADARDDKGTLKILFAGNLTEKKGISLLPQIAELLGDGYQIYYTGGLRTRNRLPPSLTPLGPISYDEMPAVYQDMDVLLFPTVREGFGLVVAEAMACGLPVVVSDCSAMPELVVQGEGGYLCRGGDAEDFAARIRQLRESPTLRAQMGQFNRQRAESLFSLKKMVDGYRQLFETVAAG